MPRESIGPMACHGLEARHLAVIEALLAGDDNSAIASRLSLSPGTVRNYISEILDILDCQSRAQVIARYEWRS